MARQLTLGTRIKRARERLRLTQKQLADQIGVNVKSIDNWENDRTVPRSSIGALEEVLGPLDPPPPAPAITVERAVREIGRLEWMDPADRAYLIRQYRQLHAPQRAAG